MSVSILLLAAVTAAFGVFSFTVAKDRANENRLRKVPVRIDKRRR